MRADAAALGSRPLVSGRTTRRHPASGWLYEARRRKYGSNLALLDLRTLRFRAITDGYGLNNYGRWSRDGRWIVFQGNRYDGELPDSTEDDSPRVETLEVYVVRADGTGLQRLTTNTYFDGHPSW